MKKIFAAIALIVLTTLHSSADSPQRGKERLRELAVVPTINLEFGFSFDFESSLVDFTAEVGLPERIAKLRAELRQQPDDAQKLIKLGCLLEKNSETNAAKACFEKAIPLCRAKINSRSRDGLALVDLGAALSALDQTEEAGSVYRKAVSVSSNEWKCWVALGRFLTSESCTSVVPTNMADSVRTLSPELLNYQPASADLERSLKSRAEALVCFERAVDIAPNEPEVFFQRALSRCSYHFTDCLIRHYRNEARLEAKDLRSKFFSKEAVSDFQKVADLCPQSYQLILLAAWFEWFSIQTGSVDASSSRPVEFSSFPEHSRQSILSAMTRLERLGESKNPKLAAGALEARAMIRYITQQDTTLMTAELRRAVVLDPTREKSWDMLLGSLVAQSAGPDEFVTVCEGRLKQKDSVRNHLLLAKSLYKQSRFEKAEVEARIALKLDTNNVPAHLMLATILIRQNKDAEFTRNLLTHVQTLIEKLPKDEEKTDRGREYALNLAIFLALDGDTALAKKWIELVLEKFPDDEQAKEILKAIP